MGERLNTTQQVSHRWMPAQAGRRAPADQPHLSAQLSLAERTKPAQRRGAGAMPAPRADDRPRKRAVMAGRGEALLEHFRRIYLSIQPFDNPGVPLSIGVTSAFSGEGRTTVATGIASAMATDLDVPVVLVEVDLAHPGVHRVLGIAPEPGIGEYLRGECEISVAVRQISDRLFVLPAGDARGEAPRLIRQLSTADLRQRLDSSGAVLVFDLPPVLELSYGVLASTMAESLLFVVRAGVTTTPHVKQALARLDESVVRGIVLNSTEPLLPGLLGGR